MMFTKSLLALSALALAAPALTFAIPQPPHDEATHGILCSDCHVPYAGLNDPVVAQGVAGAGSSGTTLADGTKVWLPGQWVGGVVTFSGGGNDGQFRKIDANDATTLTWALPLPAALAPGDGYRIGKTTQLDIETKCKSCHNPTGQASGSADVAVHVSGQHVIGCGKCHDPHNIEPNSGVGKALIRTKVRWPTARPVTVYPSGGPNAFITGEPAVNGICETCHTSTEHHCNGSPQCDHTHYAASACTDCHSHKNGFEPMGCTGCHSQPQGPRRAIVPPPGGGPGDFGMASHHVLGVVQDSDCVVCHSMKQHKQGVVLLKDPDDSATVWAASAPAAAGEFCLNCHDADGAAASTGATPFSDGATVPDIAGNGAFAASAHATGGLQCTGCHGNGHGSNLRKLLTPYDGAPGVDNVAEEEGFCYKCHAAGGVVNEMVSNGWFGGLYSTFASDIQAAFGLHSTHPVRDSEAGHAFDLGLGPQEMECTSCHDPHRDSGRYWAAPAGRSPVSLGGVWGDDPSEKAGSFDVAHTYQAPSLGLAGADLTGAPLPVDGAGASLLTAAVRPDYNTFCLSCHASPVGSVTGINWSAKKHGSAPAEPKGTLGADLKPPYDTASRGAYFLDCLDCHETHGSANTRLLRQAANGAVLANSIPDGTVKNWRYLCARCHTDGIDHHNADIYAKVGSGNCSTCHKAHFLHSPCASAGCHSHADHF